MVCDFSAYVWSSDLLDAATGRRDASKAPAPIQILGWIKADGTVLVLNPNGVLINGTSQVNVRSIVATGLEIGRSRNNGIPLTLRQRNDEFLNFGLLGYADQASQSEASNVFTFSAQAIDGTRFEPTPEREVRYDAGARVTNGTRQEERRVGQRRGSTDR